MINDGDCVAIFHSIHRVMKAEKILKQHRLEILLIPVPRQLAADCGLAIRFAEELRGVVETALAEAQLKIAEVWQLQGEQFQRI